MKHAIAACLFLFGCKEETRPAQPAGKTTPAEVAPRTAPRPSLPSDDGAPMEDGRARPRLPDDTDGGRAMRDDVRDVSDPAVREEMRALREERRKQREAMLDTNKDGVVTPEERQQRMKPMVERLDQDGDGKLTPDELAASDRRMGFDDPAAVDTNKDGEISLAELDVAVTARREKMRERWRGRGGTGSAQLPPE